MTEKISESQSRNLNPKSGANLDILSSYETKYLQERERIKAEKRGWLDSLKQLFGSKEPIEKKEEIQYNEYELSHIAKEYLDKNQKELVKENPDASCIVAYLPGQGGERGKSTKLCIPRNNPTNSPIVVSGFTLIPVPKSNGYNTEYIIRDKNGNDWTQLAILYPAEDPKYIRKFMLQSLQEFIISKIASLDKKIKKIPKKHKTEIQKLQKEITQLRSEFWQNKKRIEDMGNPERYTHFSYIPYRKGLNNQENQKKGFDYISDTMKKTYRHPVQNTSLGNLPSYAPGLTISQALPWQYPCILNLIERMDFEVYFDSSGKNLKSQKEYMPIMDSQLEKSLTTFGVNQSNSFNWQKSKVGAQGVGQIIPSTYQLYRKHPKYSALLPEGDFEKATRDHETSFRVQIAHFDDQIIQFPDIIKKNWKELITDPKTNIGIIALLAAGYNGSMSRIMKEVFGKDYREKPLTFSEYKNRLTVENIKSAMERAKDAAIADIQAKNKPRKEYNKKKKKYEILPPLPLTKEQKDEIAKIISRYKESMTYVLKAEYVWGYLNKNYKGQF